MGCGSSNSQVKDNSKKDSSTGTYGLNLNATYP